MENGIENVGLIYFHGFPLSSWFLQYINEFCTRNFHFIGRFIDL
jgi:hypothetical protein